MWIWPEGEAHIANYSWMEKSDVVSGFSPHYLWLGRLQLYKSQMPQWKWCNLTFLDTKTSKYKLYFTPVKFSPFSCTKCKTMKEVHNGGGRLQLLQFDYKINILLGKAQNAKTSINLTSIRARSNSVTNHFSVSYVTTPTVNKKCLDSKAAQTVAFYFTLRKRKSTSLFG